MATPAALTCDQRYERRTCGMAAALLSIVRRAATGDAETLEGVFRLLIEDMGIPDMVLMLAPPIGLPTCVVGNSDG